MWFRRKVALRLSGKNMLKMVRVSEYLTYLSKPSINFSMVTIDSLLVTSKLDSVLSYEPRRFSSKSPRPSLLLCASRVGGEACRS